jgi:hypothetical protein
MGCTRAADPGLKSAKNTILTIEPSGIDVRLSRDDEVVSQGHQRSPPQAHAFA